MTGGSLFTTITNWVQLLWFPWMSVAVQMTLLVPVESGTIGASGQAVATRRFVPSPPSTSSAPQPASRIAATARSVSAGRVSGRPSSSRSHTASIGRYSSALSAMRNTSGVQSMRGAPASAAPIAARSSWLRFAPGVSLPARPSRRRTSRPESGFTIKPSGRGAGTAADGSNAVSYSAG